MNHLKVIEGSYWAKPECNRIIDAERVFPCTSVNGEYDTTGTSYSCERSVDEIDLKYQIVLAFRLSEVSLIGRRMAYNRFEEAIIVLFSKNQVNK